jgi:REP element-mobilizing transposase RayT
MARIPRLLLRGESATYHVVSRTALQGFVLGDVEKDLFVRLLRRLAGVYFAELFGFAVMGNHVHLLVRMRLPDEFPDEEVRRRFSLYYGEARAQTLSDAQLPFYREKWASLSEFVKDVKQSFSRQYNKTHGRRGYFWSERFKSVLVDSGDTLVNCLAYIDLNAVRAGIVDRPEKYRWCSLAHHVQTGNADGLLSTDFGLRPFADLSDDDRLRQYRKFVYEVGSLPSEKGARIADTALAEEERSDFRLSGLNRFLYRTRYFTDSGVIGTKEFVARCACLFEGHFACRHAKRPRPISGLDGVYSLKRLAEGSS